MFPASMLGKGYPILVPCKNGETTALRAGTPVAWDHSAKDNITVKKITAANLADFAGILVKPLEAGSIAGQANNALCVEGKCPANFINSASADGSANTVYAEPVASQIYLNAAANPTRILLVTDQDSGTDVHYADEEGADGPYVIILPAKFQVKHMVFSNLAENATHYACAPGHIRLLGGRSICSADPGAGGGSITVTDGSNTALTMTVANGSSAGDVDEASVTAANAIFTESESLRIVMPNFTNAITCTVIIDYIEL